ncbi:hypothetical protein [Clostridium formicaceticum]|uniref:Uncharacterized protein n=1 Tax=Clostridium formicaceticum TaxID=1497 RepID=A0AAC9WF52_9CLOT|nr:hypothetical protein [Clostridium formicaceticum]AOY75998.1 hypothetical protein BJL90_08865 [Clostridium formicaceticum]ARE86353.1 hypothetical protein CLFO_06750 [Clostridium formicaceticum]
MRVKKSRLVISVTMMLVMSLVMVYASDVYIIFSDGWIEAYGYGADFYADAASATSDTTGVKVRYRVYRDGIRVLDSSVSDTTAPYEAVKEGTVSSTKYSNNWKLDVTPYGRYSGSPEWIVFGTASYTDRN